jgi:hypothetical protein
VVAPAVDRLAQSLGRSTEQGLLPDRLVLLRLEQTPPVARGNLLLLGDVGVSGPPRLLKRVSGSAKKTPRLLIQTPPATCRYAGQTSAESKSNLGTV